MSTTRFAAAFALLGVLVACSLNAVWSLFERSIQASHYYFLILKGTLLLFPAFIGTIAISGTKYWGLESIALIGMNGVFYAIVGLLVWLGLRKHRAYFAVLFLIYVAFIGGVWALH
jgi:hypothetical protein